MKTLFYHFTIWYSILNNREIIWIHGASVLSPPSYSPDRELTDYYISRLLQNTFMGSFISRENRIPAIKVFALKTSRTFHKVSTTWVAIKEVILNNGEYVIEWNIRKIDYLWLYSLSEIRSSDRFSVELVFGNNIFKAVIIITSTSRIICGCKPRKSIVQTSKLSSEFKFVLNWL